MTPVAITAAGRGRSQLMPLTLDGIPQDQFQRFAAACLAMSFILYIPAFKYLFFNPTRHQDSPLAWDLLWLLGQQGYAALVIPMAMTMKSGRTALIRAWAGYPLLVVAAYSSTWSIDSKSSWTGIIDATVPLVAIPAVIMWTGPRETFRTIGIVNGVLALSSVFAVLLFKNAAILAPGDVDGDQYAGAWRGITIAKNTLGEVSAAAAIFLLAPRRGESRDWRIAWWVFRICALICLVKAHSVGSSVGFAVGAVVFYVFNSKLLSNPFVIVATVLFVIGMVAGTSLSLDTLLGLIGRNSTFSNRTLIWALALQMIREAPIFGHGYNTVDFIFRETAIRTIGPDAVNTHEAYLDVLFDIGVVGLVCVLLHAFMAVIKGYAILFDADDEQRTRVAAYVGVIAAAMVMATQEVSAFRMTGQGTTAFYLAGSCLLQERFLSRRKKGVRLTAGDPNADPPAIFAAGPSRPGQPIARPVAAKLARPKIAARLAPKGRAATPGDRTDKDPARSDEA